MGLLFSPEVNESCAPAGACFPDSKSCWEPDLAELAFCEGEICPSRRQHCA